MKPEYEMGRDAYIDQRTLVPRHNATTIFDVGANLGNTVEKYQQLFDGSMIYAFEPGPETHQRLEERFEDFACIEALHAAVTDEEGTKQFCVNIDPATSSLLPRPRSGRRYYNRMGVTKAIVQVPCVTIDGFCHEREIDHIDIVKLDVQGGELMALQGARHLLSNMAITLIYCEVQFIPLYEGAPLFHEINRFLEEYDYTLYGIYDWVVAMNGQLRFADALFIHPDIRTNFLDRFDPEPY